MYGGVVMLTAKQLEEIRARAEKATKGPWYAKATDDDHSQCCNFISTVPGPFEHDQRFIGEQDDETVVALTLLQAPRLADAPEFEENTEFIAHARDDIPALLAEVERLRVGLRQIAESKYCDYAETSSGIYKGCYGVGVTDGHRYCSNIARKVLGEPFIEDEQEAPDEA